MRSSTVRDAAEVLHIDGDTGVSQAEDDHAACRRGGGFEHRCPFHRRGQGIAMQPNGCVIRSRWLV